MNKLNLITGLLLVVSAATAQAAVIVDLADVPATATVLDFESYDGEVFASGTFNYGSLSMTASQQFTAGQNVADLDENGIWGAGNHFLSFDHIGNMTLDISFNGHSTKGFAFDYSVLGCPFNRSWRFASTGDLARIAPSWAGVLGGSAAWAEQTLGSGS